MHIVTVGHIVQLVEFKLNFGQIPFPQIPSCVCVKGIYLTDCYTTTTLLLFNVSYKYFLL